MQDRRRPPKTAGLREVAAEAGVSAATVSNTLNRPEMVAPETRARINAAIERLGFVAHLGASSLKRGKNRLIGLLLPDVTNPFYNEIARGALEAADELRYAVVLCNSQDEPARETRQLQMLAEQRAVGVLVVPLSADRTRLDQLRQLGSRLVVIDRAVPESTGCSVSIDDVHGGRLATQHLLDTRGPDLALVNGHDAIRQCADRRTGAREAWATTGLPSGRLPEHVVDEMTSAEGARIGRELARAGAPRGVVCTNDQLAVGVIRGLSESGVDVPARTAVVGYGNLAIAAEAAVPLTTVDQPKYALGHVAVERLIEEIDQPDGAHRHAATVFRPTMVLRRSAP
jgi:LacI family transcriptional regulator